jgi:hypothetical protein
VPALRTTRKTPSPLVDVKASQLYSNWAFAVFATFFVLAFLATSNIGHLIVTNMVAPKYAVGTVSGKVPTLKVNPVPPATNDPLRIPSAIFAVTLIALAVASPYVIRKLQDFKLRHPTAITQGITAAAAAIAVFAIAVSWTFDLDDKWINWRTSYNVLHTGLPYWNASDKLNVNTSFAFPYLIALGHLTPYWEAFAKLVGVLFLVLTALLFKRAIRDRFLSSIGVALSLLYYPALLWSLGVIDTTLGAFYICLASCWLLLKPNQPLAWAGLGAALFVRPDLLLVGIGAYIVRVLFSKRPISERIHWGVYFSCPVISFVALNALLFAYPFPTPFYIKGWNKSFSGSFPLYFDIFMGSHHCLSGILLSFLLVAVIAAATLVAVARRHKPSLTLLGLLAGTALHLGYVIACGYQHMSFTFRYFVPPLTLLGFLCLWYLADYLRSRTPDDEEVRWFQGALASAFLIQCFMTSFLAYYGLNGELSLTTAGLRDSFSIKSYLAVMDNFRDLGKKLNSIATSDSRLFWDVDVAAAAVSLTKAYDYFYAPAFTSSDLDLRVACGERDTDPQWVRGVSQCISSFDYWIRSTGNPTDGFQLIETLSGVSLYRKFPPRAPASPAQDSASASPMFDYGMDRPGHDYKVFKPNDPYPLTACRSACIADPDCKAFAFSLGGEHIGKCFLKNEVARLTSNAQAISGRR